MLSQDEERLLLKLLCLVRNCPSFRLSVFSLPESCHVLVKTAQVPQPTAEPSSWECGPWADTVPALVFTRLMMEGRFFRRVFHTGIDQPPPQLPCESRRSGSSSNLHLCLLAFAVSPIAPPLSQQSVFPFAAKLPGLCLRFSQSISRTLPTCLFIICLSLAHLRSDHPV